MQDAAQDVATQKRIVGEARHRTQQGKNYLRNRLLSLRGGVRV